MNQGGIDPDPEDRSESVCGCMFSKACISVPYNRTPVIPFYNRVSNVQNAQFSRVKDASVMWKPGITVTKHMHIKTKMHSCKQHLQ